MVGPILEALERKIGLRRDATRAPLRAPEWQRATSMPRPPRNTQISTRPRLTYCGPKLVLTKGSTLVAAGLCQYDIEPGVPWNGDDDVLVICYFSQLLFTADRNVVGHSLAQ